MSRLLAVFALSCVTAVCGCANEQNPPARAPAGNGAVPEAGSQAPGGLKIDAPGVHIDINDKDGVQVDAPGTEVRVNEKDGVKVDAPGAEVEAKENP